MASRWNFKTSTKGKLNVNTPIASPDLSARVIHSDKKSFLERLRDKLFHFISKDNLKLGLKYLAFIIPLIAMVYLANKLYERQTLNSKAGIGQASLFFQSNNLTLPPDSDLTIITNSSGPVGFAKVEANFDPSVVILTSEIDVSTSPLQRIIKISSMAEANSTGKIVVILGLDPSSVSNPPSGSFQIAKFRVSKNTVNNNVASSISFSTANSQIVNLDQTLFNLTATNLSILVNPVVTIAPTATATAVSSTPNPTTQATIAPVSTPTTAGKDCRACHKGKCDNSCDPKRDGVSCPDCL